MLTSGLIANVHITIQTCTYTIYIYFFFFFNYICHSLPVEIRGKFGGIGSLYHVDFGDRTRVTTSAKKVKENNLSSKGL